MFGRSCRSVANMFSIDDELSPSKQTFIQGFQNQNVFTLLENLKFVKKTFKTKMVIYAIMKSPYNRMGTAEANIIVACSII